MKNPRFTGAALGAMCALLIAPVVVAQDNFDLDALIEAAGSENPITVYDSTGKIVEMAEGFSQKYGLEATGVKISASAQFEQIIREAQSGNVQGDVALFADTAAVVAQLIPQGYVESWLPLDMAQAIPAEYRDPLAISNSVNVFAYNTEVYDSCPVSNIWQVTDPAWNGRFAMVDPLTKPTYIDWFNQMQTYADDEMAQAYEEYYGHALETDLPSATAAWVVALAESAPLLVDNSPSDAIGAPGQSEPFFGLLSSAKFRENEDSEYVLGLCSDIRPWIGFSYTKLGLIASGTESPNAAKLFIHYVLTEEGIMPQMIDGKFSTNSEISLPEDEPSGIGDHIDRLLAYNAATALDDWDARQDWQDLWMIHYSR